MNKKRTEAPSIILTAGTARYSPVSPEMSISCTLIIKEVEYSYNIVLSSPLVKIAENET